jgi:hypothetical protein
MMVNRWSNGGQMVAAHQPGPFSAARRRGTRRRRRGKGECPNVAALGAVKAEEERQPAAVKRWSNSGPNSGQLWFSWWPDGGGGGGGKKMVKCPNGGQTAVKTAVNYGSAGGPMAVVVVKSGQMSNQRSNAATTRGERRPIRSNEIVIRPIIVKGLWPRFDRGLTAVWTERRPIRSNEMVVKQRSK